MKTTITTFCCMLLALHCLASQPCQGSSFFEMTLKRDSIYTPGKMNISLKLTDKARIEGDYRFQVSVYVAEALMRKQVLPITKAKPVVFELTFPQARSKTNVRCRAELFLNGAFVEAQERPLILWPPLELYTRKPNETVIWVYDVSGRLQRFFGDSEVDFTDATFQAARDFSTPDIVFIGPELDPNSMRVITHRLASIDSKPVVIFLRQNQLPKGDQTEIPEINNHPKSVVCDNNSPLLQGLNKLDIMAMLDSVSYIRISKLKDNDWSIDSHVTETMGGKKSVHTYLSTIEEEGQVTIYCQLYPPDGDDPRYDVLLQNILKFAHKVVESKKADNRT